MTNKSKLEKFAKDSEGQGINISQPKLCHSSQRPYSLASLPVILPQRSQFHLRPADLPMIKIQSQTPKHSYNMNRWCDRISYHQTYLVAWLPTLPRAKRALGGAGSSSVTQPQRVAEAFIRFGKGTFFFNNTKASFLSPCDDQRRSTTNTRR